MKTALIFLTNHCSFSKQGEDDEQEFRHEQLLLLSDRSLHQDFKNAKEAEQERS